MRDCDDVGFILKNAATHKLLTFEEEQKYAFAYLAGKKPDATEAEKKRAVHAKQKIIASNIRLVVTIARKRAAKEVHLSLADMIQEGVLGLDKAIERFDPSKGWRFSTYAYFWVRQHVWECAGAQHRPMSIPLHILESVVRARRIKTELEAAGQKAGLKEVAARIKVQPATLKRYFELAVSTLSLDREDGVTDVPIDDPELGRKDEVELIESWIMQLPEAVRIALCHTFGLMGFDILTPTAIGKQLSPRLNSVKVQALIDEGLDALRNQIPRELEQENTIALILSKKGVMRAKQVDPERMKAVTTLRNMLNKYKEVQFMAFEAYRQTDPFESAVTEKTVKAVKAGERTAKQLVPVDTGALRDSIKVEDPESNGSETIVRLVAGNDEVDYAYEQEMLKRSFLQPAIGVIESELKNMVS